MRQSRNVREVRKHRRKWTASLIGTGESSSFQTYSVNAIMFAVFIAGIQLACTNFIEQIREVFPCMEPYTRFHGWTTRIWTGISRRYLYWWQPRRDMYPPSRRLLMGEICFVVAFGRFCSISNFTESVYSLYLPFCFARYVDLPRRSRAHGNLTGQR